jgi:pyruvate dehydrogenase E1 component
MKPVAWIASGATAPVKAMTTWQFGPGSRSQYAPSTMAWRSGIVTVLDGHPATLAWLGAVGGHRVRPLGVEHFGQTGTIAELYRHYGIDANAIIAAAQTIAPGKPLRHLRAL